VDKSERAAGETAGGRRARGRHPRHPKSPLQHAHRGAQPHGRGI